MGPGEGGRWSKGEEPPPPPAGMKIKATPCPPPPEREQPPLPRTIFSAPRKQSKAVKYGKITTTGGMI